MGRKKRWMEKNVLEAAEGMFLDPAFPPPPTRELLASIARTPTEFRHWVGAGEVASHACMHSGGLPLPVASGLGNVGRENGLGIDRNRLEFHPTDYTHHKRGLRFNAACTSFSYSNGVPGRVLTGTLYPSYVGKRNIAPSSHGAGRMGRCMGDRRKSCRVPVNRLSFCCCCSPSGGSSHALYRKAKKRTQDPWSPACILGGARLRAQTSAGRI